MSPGLLADGSFSEEAWDFGDDLGQGGCVVDSLEIPNEPGFCGTIALERSMGIGIWKGPSEVDVLIDLLGDEFSEVIAGLTRAESVNFTAHLVRNMDWEPQGLDPEDPKLVASLQHVVRDLQASSSLTELAEQWLTNHRRGW